MLRPFGSAETAKATIDWSLRVLLILIFGLAPIGALAATPDAMPAACGEMSGMGDHDDDLPMACCDVICVIAGSCAVLPTPLFASQAVAFETPVPNASRSQDRTGVSSAPEPPPPRHGGL